MIPEVPANPPPNAPTGRFGHVDALRGIAALLVVWLHLSTLVAPYVGPDPGWLWFLRGVPEAIDVGRIGVVIFFAISGFVICRSFDKGEGAAGRFVVRRLCRLYPAYWAALLGGMWVWWLKAELPSWTTLLANVTMAPSLFGQDFILGVCWTLEIELMFYAICLCLHRTRWLEWPWLLAASSLALTGLSRWWRIVDREGHPGLLLGRHVFCLGLAVMLWGVLFRTAYDATDGFRRGWWRNRTAWLTVATGGALPIVLDPKNGWFLLGMRPDGMPSHFATAVGLWTFAAWVAWLRWERPWLIYLGAISYSVYLWHEVVVVTIYARLSQGLPLPGAGGPFWAWCIVVLVATILVSSAIYRWVEAPAIAQGKRWTTRRKPPAERPAEPAREAASPRI